MPKEKPTYRDNLELILQFLNQKYGDNRKMLTNKDIQEFTGRSYKYVKKEFMDNLNLVSAANFARALS